MTMAVTMTTAVTMTLILTLTVTMTLTMAVTLTLTVTVTVTVSALNYESFSSLKRLDSRQHHVTITTAPLRVFELFICQRPCFVDNGGVFAVQLDTGIIYPAQGSGVDVIQAIHSDGLAEKC